MLAAADWGGGVTSFLKAPFPYFGGKSRVAPLIWDRFGDVPNLVDPFAGSLALLLARPHDPRIETVNDADCFISNFWRALQADPDGVAKWADWPVSEPDLHARHLWIVTWGREHHERMLTDPDFYDVKVAGWWVWGISQWIGSGWCRTAGMAGPRQRPHLADAGMDVHRKLPHLGDAGMGVHRQLPHLGNAGMGERLRAYLGALSERLRGVRVCCGDWTRVLGPSVTTKHGLTAVFLDPPYAQSERHDELYAVETDVSAEVRQWAITHGDDPLLRICLAGYDGEHEMPDGWECVAWKTAGGYGSQGDDRGRANAHRERLWFSQACLKPGTGQLSLFDMEAAS